MEREAELLDPSDRLALRRDGAAGDREAAQARDLHRPVAEGAHARSRAADASRRSPGLYERAREWKPLADVLEKQSQRLGGDELKQLLAKLGMIYADKLTDDRGAVSAFQRLLALDPDDKRAQEQLKRRYVAIKAWDELEAFYAPSGKWDELIRTLEREAGNKDARRRSRSTSTSASRASGRCRTRRPRGTRLREGPRARRGEPRRGRSRSRRSTRPRAMRRSSRAPTRSASST
jgi:hypothetical protein